MAASDDPAVVRRTQVLDLARSLPLGVLLPLESSVLLTIAIKRFDASGPVKGLIAASAGIGLLASPLVTSVARRTGRPVMALAALDHETKESHFTLIVPVPSAAAMDDATFSTMMSNLREAMAAR